MQKAYQDADIVSQHIKVLEENENEIEARKIEEDIQNAFPL